MNQPLVDLLELQALDDRIGHLRALLTGGPDRLVSARAELGALELKLADLNIAVEKHTLRHRELEGEIKELAAKREKAQAKQMMAKSNEELQALVREAEHLSVEISRREDEALEVLDVLDKLAVAKPDLEAALSEEALNYGRKASEIEAALSDGREKEAEAAARRAELAASLPEDLLGQYGTLFKSRGGSALSPVSGGMCLACRLAVPPQVYNELQRNQRIVTCPNCNRIVYWREHPDFQQG